MSDGPSTWHTKTAVGVSSVKKSGADAGINHDAEIVKHVVASELHGEVPSEPVGRFYNDRLCAVGGENSEAIRKAGGARRYRSAPLTALS